MENAASTCVIVFAKAPIEGQAKTRLIPAIGATAATQLYCAMVHKALKTATQAGLGQVILCCAPDEHHDFFATCARKYNVMLMSQSGGDLGTRMFDALHQGLQKYACALIIGTDCPALSMSDLCDAAAALTSHEVVVVPAEDGGYVLIGAARADARLFNDIAWSGPHVMRDTRRNVDLMGWRVKELHMLWDVDVPADLQRLAEAGIFVPLCK